MRDRLKHFTACQILFAKPLQVHMLGDMSRSRSACHTPQDITGGREDTLAKCAVLATANLK